MMRSRRRVERNRERLMTFLSSLKGKGKRLAGYGAPAKGNTLLNYCDIGRDFLAISCRSQCSQTR